jgi:hypothetical protein
MRGENYPRTIEYWIWGGIFVTTILLLVVLGRIAFGVIQTSHAAGKSDENGIQQKMLLR